MMQMTKQIAMAAARDAGNSSMATAGRSAWNGDDYSEAAREYVMLWPIERELGVQKMDTEREV